MSEPTEQPPTATTAVAEAPAPAKPKHADSDYHSGWFGVAQWLAGVVVIAVFVMTFIVQAFEIPSESMEDTLLIGDYLLVDKIDYASGGAWGHILPYTPVKRGDIIVFRYPVNPQQHFVKRVIGLPGDRVRIANKQVFVNGQPTDEKRYVVFKSASRDPFRDDFPNPQYPAAIDPKWWAQMRKLVERGELIVPSGHYFALGDNRDESLDSRYWGFVPEENIVGRPLFIYWSVEKDSAIPEYDESGSVKLTRFLYAMTHVFKETRWDRTFRRVK
ncbi:MAG TPA: signal peptidase I [Terriglobales bacterium]|nr:signal peptidase I [Terriglobales bacterium]